MVIYYRGSPICLRGGPPFTNQDPTLVFCSHALTFVQTPSSPLTQPPFRCTIPFLGDYGNCKPYDYRSGNSVPQKHPVYMTFHTSIDWTKAQTIITHVHIPKTTWCICRPRAWHCWPGPSASRQVVLLRRAHESKGHTTFTSYQRPSVSREQVAWLSQIKKHPSLVGKTFGWATISHKSHLLVTPVQEHPLLGCPFLTGNEHRSREVGPYGILYMISIPTEVGQNPSSTIPVGYLSYRS